MAHPLALPSTDVSHTVLESALVEWKAARRALSKAIGLYLDACAPIYSACEPEWKYHFGSPRIEEALAVVNAELDSLGTEEYALRNARAMLAKNRNISATLAPINTLPPEILAYIFSLSQQSCARNSGNEIAFNDIAAVCHYWRRIALEETHLWNHIDIGPDTPSGFTSLFLNRSMGRPIHVHVFEIEPRLDNSESAPIYESETTKLLLTPHIQRVRALDVVSSSHMCDLACAVINLWLENGDPSVCESLVIFQPWTGQLWFSDLNMNAISVSSENARAVLSSLGTLQLDRAMFEWNSVAYHGLVDLRLSSPVSISISELYGMLLASPRLSTLKLESLTITPVENWIELDPVHLCYLKVLNLVSMNQEDVGVLMPVIDPYSPPAGLSVGLEHCGSLPDGMKNFLAHARITTLYLHNSRLNQGDSSLPSPLPCLPPSLRMLVLECYIIDVITNSTSRAVNSSTDPPSSSLTVVLQSCGATLKSLKRLVIRYQIKELYLEDCQIYARGSESNNLQKIKDIPRLLSAIDPGLRCYVSDEVSTMPCCMMFEYD